MPKPGPISARRPAPAGWGWPRSIPMRTSVTTTKTSRSSVPASAPGRRRMEARAMRASVTLLASAAHVAAVMERYAGTVPGASVLVLHDGQPAIRRAWGMSDLESGMQAAPSTNYRLASVSKQFTAAAILLLAEDGRLEIEDPVRTWLP